MSNEAVCRTAPATPGLLTTLVFILPPMLLDILVFIPVTSKLSFNIPDLLRGRHDCHPPKSVLYDQGQICTELYW